MSELKEILKNISEEKNAKIIPENIRAGIKIFDITGTYTSDADATARDIATGKTAYVNGEKINGIFEPLDTSDATATAEDIVEGKTAYVDNRKISGTLTGEEKVANLDFSELEIVEILPIESKYLSKVTINKDENLLPENIKKDIVINGIIGNADIIDFYISNCSYLFNANSRIEIKDKILPLCKNVTNMSQMFLSCSNLTELDLTNFDASNVISMDSTFQNCVNTITIDVSNFNTNKLKNCYHMFYNCSKLVNVDVSSFNFSIVENASDMFYNCKSLSNESLNSILKMCSTMKLNYITRTLKHIGLTSAQATTCTTLSNYQAFLDAGWITGY